MPTKEKMQASYKDDVSQPHETAPKKFLVDLDLISMWLQVYGYMAVCDIIRKFQLCKDILEIYFTHSTTQELYEDCNIRYGFKARETLEEAFQEYFLCTERIIYRDKKILDRTGEYALKFGRQIRESSAIHDIYGLTIANPCPLQYAGLNVSCCSGEALLLLVKKAIPESLEKLYEQEEEIEIFPPGNDDDDPPPPYHPRNPGGGNPPTKQPSGGSGFGSGKPHHQGKPQGNAPNLPSNSDSSGNHSASSNSPPSTPAFSSTNKNQDESLATNSSKHPEIANVSLPPTDTKLAKTQSHSLNETVLGEQDNPLTNPTQQFSAPDKALTKAPIQIAQSIQSESQQSETPTAETGQLSQNLTPAGDQQNLATLRFRFPPDDDFPPQRVQPSPGLPSGSASSTGIIPTSGSSSNPSTPDTSTNTKNSGGISTPDTSTSNRVSGENGNQVFTVQTGDGQITIDNFGGVGRGDNPSQEIISAIDTIRFKGVGLTAANMLLTQQGDDLVITFEGSAMSGVILKNVSLENLDNLAKDNVTSTAFGNIVFDGDDSIQDSFDIFNSEWVLNQVLKPNTTTFLNDLDNFVMGFDNANNVINGQGGNDTLIAFSGNDVLRGGAGDDILDGGTGTNTLWGGSGSDTFMLCPYGHHYVNDFKIGEDYIGLPSGLTFDQLKIEQGTGINSGSTLIKISGDDTTSMLLRGIQASALTTDSFLRLSDQWRSPLS
jgi:RTX calcium-binding nonapeptide repeat (4 copies)